MAKVVYTKNRYWRKLGLLEQILSKYPAPWKGESIRLTIRRAIMNYQCYECGGDIVQYERHGGKMVQVNNQKIILRFCLNCVVAVRDKPDTIYAKDH